MQNIAKWILKNPIFFSHTCAVHDGAMIHAYLQPLWLPLLNWFWLIQSHLNSSVTVTFTQRFWFWRVWQWPLFCLFLRHQNCNQFSSIRNEWTVRWRWSLEKKACCFDRLSWHSRTTMMQLGRCRQISLNNEWCGLRETFLCQRQAISWFDSDQVPPQSTVPCQLRNGCHSGRN